MPMRRAYAKVIGLSLLMLLLPLSGCMEGPRVQSNDSTTSEQLELPEWEVGDYWLYTFVTPQFGEDSARLVVAESDNESGLYRLGISSLRESQRHAVINHNPFLGRVTMDGLSVYENGDPQPVFNFPWNVGDEWNFVLLGQSWTAQTVNIYNGEIDVIAESEESHSLIYTFSASSMFLESFVWTDDSGQEQLRMQIAKTGSDYSGEVWFHRATDLKDETYLQNDNDIYDTFFDSGHPSGEEFDHLVWYIDVEISQGGSGSLTISDHTSASPLTRAWGSGSTEKGAIGTIPSTSDEYSMTVTLRGQTSVLHVKIAGAIEYQWTL